MLEGEAENKSIGFADAVNALLKDARKSATWLPSASFQPMMAAGFDEKVL